jgi:5,5'-dehydrodivanillate O-demethylase
MGELMRRYWHPIAAASQLDVNPTKSVRLLGEDLVLFKDRSGNLGLIYDRCPHRRVNLIYGMPEKEGIRCAYHGWVFNSAGQCIEQPYEETEDPEGRFKDKITTPAYRVQELGGLIFAYLGPEPAPLLPEWDLFAFKNVYRDIGACVIPCNWLQVMENSVDPVHAEWAHGHFANYVNERKGLPEYIKPIRAHKKIGFDVFEHGIIKRRVLEGQDENGSNWTVGHPLVFPNFLKVGGYQYRTPIDDTHTLHIWYTTYAPGEGETVPEDAPIPFYQVPMPTMDEDGNPNWNDLDYTAGQDLVNWESQGPIADRSEENLGRSDRGVILFRQLLRENLDKVARGEDPMNVFRDAAKAKNIHLPHESEQRSQTPQQPMTPNMVGAVGRGGGGATEKYSVILKTTTASSVAVEKSLK